MTHYPPAENVFACAHWQTTCRDTEAQPEPYWDYREPPLCGNGHVMDVSLSLREWRAGVGWPR